MQYVIVGLLVLASVIYLVRSMMRSAKGHACEGGNCNCSPESLKKN